MYTRTILKHFDILESNVRVSFFNETVTVVVLVVETEGEDTGSEVKTVIVVTIVNNSRRIYGPGHNL